MISCNNNTALFMHANEESFQRCTDNTPAVTQCTETHDFVLFNSAYYLIIQQAGCGQVLSTSRQLTEGTGKSILRKFTSYCNIMQCHLCYDGLPLYFMLYPVNRRRAYAPSVTLPSASQLLLHGHFLKHREYFNVYIRRKY